MKFFKFLALLFSATTLAQVQTPQASPIAEFTQIVGLTKIKITYSRPAMKGRKIMGDLVPYGAIWRTGANEATIITVYKQIQIDNLILEPGTYTLFTIPKGNTITVIISKPNSNFNWGTYSYNSDDDILRLNVPLNKDENSLDVFSVAFSANSEQPKIFFGWGLKRFEVPFQVVNWI